MDVAGVPNNTCLSLALQVLNKLIMVPIDLSYHTLIPMMLAYGPKSYAYQTWHEDGGETSVLSGKTRASHILTQKLEGLAHGEGVNDSGSNRSALLAQSPLSSSAPLPKMLYISIPFPVQEPISAVLVKCIPIQFCC